MGRGEGQHEADVVGRIDAGQEVQGDGWSADRQLNQELVSFDNLSLGQEHILVSICRVVITVIYCIRV